MDIEMENEIDITAAWNLEEAKAPFPSPLGSVEVSEDEGR